MGVLVLPRREFRRSHIGNIRGIDPYWEAHGIACAYVLYQDKWRIDQVTGRELGTYSGVAPTFPEGKLRTDGTGTSYVSLPHNCSTPITNTVSFIHGSKFISGTGRNWTLYSNNATTNGWSHGSSGNTTLQVVSGGNNISVTSVIDNAVNHCAFVLNGDNNAYGVSVTSAGNPIRWTDTGNTVPTVTRTEIAIGATVRDSVLSVSVCDFEYFAVFESALPREVAMSLIVNPWQLFKQSPKKTYFFFSAGSSAGVAKAIYFWGAPP